MPSRAVHIVANAKISFFFRLNNIHDIHNMTQRDQKSVGGSYTHSFLCEHTHTHTRTRVHVTVLHALCCRSCVFTPVHTAAHTCTRMAALPYPAAGLFRFGLQQSARLPCHPPDGVRLPHGSLKHRGLFLGSLSRGRSRTRSTEE